MSNWQQELTKGFSNAKDLLNFLKIDDDESINHAELQFKTKVPISFANRMEKGNKFDPLLIQVLASSIELQELEGFTTNPLQEDKYNPVPGLIHKYHNRVLLTLSGACAVNCRYCFRRHFAYKENSPGKNGIPAIINYLNAHPQVEEIILSGGDPLILNNHYFEVLLDALKACASIQTLRIHSRIPIVLPSRIESNWLDLLNQYSWHKVMVTHANHPAEINKDVEAAVKSLKDYGWMVLNQSVLLKGVNNKVAVLERLSKALFKIGILPYYLHLLDPVAGAAHFGIPLVEAKQLYAELQSTLSGYLLPRLVQEVPGIPHKTLVK